MTTRTGLSLSQYYRLSWLLLLAAITALVLASQIVPPAMILLVALFSSLLIAMSPERLAPFLRLIRLLIGILLTLFLVYEVRSYRNMEHGIRIMIELIIGVLPLTIITYKERRSYWLSVLNVTVVAIGSIALGENLATFVVFLFFMIALVISLNAANLYLESFLEGETETRNFLPRYYIWHVFRALPAGLITAFLIFFTFPRAHNFSLGFTASSDRSTTGFSGLIDLRSKGGIEKSGALAALLQSQDSSWLRQHTQDLLLRGNVLGTFDGEKWSSPKLTNSSYTLASGIPISKIDPNTRHIVTVHLESHTHKYLFYPDVLLSILERPSAMGSLVAQEDGSLIRTETELARFEYSIKTAPRSPLGEFGSKSIEELTVDLPLDLIPLTRVDPSLEISSWFVSWTKEVDINPGDSLSQLEKKLLAYFTRNYRPSLSVDHSGENPLRDFLTTKRAGHCEYFATATTLYLRSLGLPARAVVGYRGGIYNSLIDALEVRNEHAHAWSEVWVTGYGWHPIDTSPALTQSSTIASSLSLFLNALQYWFRKYFLDYNQGTQKELIRTLQNIAQKSTQRDLWQWDSLFSLTKKHSLWTISGVFLFIIFGLITLKRRRRSPWPRYYQRFLKQMTRFGFTRREGETLRTFHKRILDSEILPLDQRTTVVKIAQEIEKDLYSRRP